MTKESDLTDELNIIISVLNTCVVALKNYDDVDHDSISNTLFYVVIERINNIVGDLSKKTK